ncbi:unnamed protein product [Amoebophrya sp. A120]|nr:unnamed protein product [Amoebophrya sp. A120]|eukprot:GSA120T00000432001.1
MKLLLFSFVVLLFCGGGPATNIFFVKADQVQLDQKPHPELHFRANHTNTDQLNARIVVFDAPGTTAAQLVHQHDRFEAAQRGKSENAASASQLIVGAGTTSGAGKTTSAASTTMSSVYDISSGRSSSSLEDNDKTSRQNREWTVLHVTDVHLNMPLTDSDRPFNQRMDNAFRNAQNVYLTEPTGRVDTDTAAPASSSRARTSNPRETFQKLLDLYKRENADLLLLGGDLFNFPQPNAVEWVLEELRKHDIRFLYTGGNHDFMTEGKPQEPLLLQKQTAYENVLKPLLFASFGQPVVVAAFGGRGGSNAVHTHNSDTSRKNDPLATLPGGGGAAMASSSPSKNGEAIAAGGAGDADEMLDQSGSFSGAGRAPPAQLVKNLMLYHHHRNRNATAESLRMNRGYFRRGMIGSTTTGSTRNSPEAEEDGQQLVSVDRIQRPGEQQQADIYLHTEGGVVDDLGATSSASAQAQQGDMVLVSSSPDDNAYASTYPPPDNHLYSFPITTVETESPVSVAELGPFLIVAIDNSDLQVREEARQAVVAQLQRNRPTLLLMHYGLHANPDLVQNPSGAQQRTQFILCGDRKFGWAHDTGYNVEKRERWPKSGNLPSTERFAREILADYLSPKGPVVGILSGHEHVHRVDELSPHAKQYVALPAFQGGYRKVVLQDVRARRWRRRNRQAALRARAALDQGINTVAIYN